MHKNQLLWEVMAPLIITVIVLMVSYENSPELPLAILYWPGVATVDITELVRVLGTALRDTTAGSKRHWC